MILKQFTVFCLLLLVPSFVTAKIVFTSPRGDGHNNNIYVMDDDGSNIQRLTFPPHHDFSTVWSPNGRYIAFSRSMPNEPKQGQRESLFIIDQNGANERMITDGQAIDAQCTWAPDGNRIAFSSNRSGDVEIHVVDINTGEIQQLTRSPGHAMASAPSWSPDGKYIAYRYLPEKGSSTIYVMKANGTGANALVKSDGWTRYHPRWAPDSKSILYYEVKYGEKFRVIENNVVIQKYGDNHRQILQTPKSWELHFVAWMDKDKQVLIVAKDLKEDNSQMDIYRYHIATGEITNLTNHPLDDYDVDWISDDVLFVNPLDKKKIQWGTLKK